AAAGSAKGGAGGSPPAFLDVVRPPDHVTAYPDGGAPFPLRRSGERWREQDVEASTEPHQRAEGRELSVKISSPQTSLARVHLRWSGSLPEDLRFLGDHWERSYGDL